MKFIFSRAWLCGTLLIAMAWCAGLSAQTCMVPAPADHQLHPVWGGETWATCSEEVNGSLRIWTGEDGGRLRTSFDGGATWIYADTPDDFTGSIFDIWFFDGGTHGFATGRGGRVLETLDGGISYNYFGSQILDAGGDPATLWGVRALSNRILLVSGLWTFKATADGGATWFDLNVYDRDPSLAGAQLISHHDLIWFRFDLIGSLGSFVGSAGATMETTSGNQGVVLFTDASLPQAGSGRNWWITLNDGNQPPSANGATMRDPWAVRFERGSTSTTNSVGYVIGGRTGNQTSRFYRTTDSGRSWTLDGDLTVTAYDVTSDLSGQAMIVGYSGFFTTRDPQTGVWTEAQMPSPSTLFPTPGFSLGALLGATSFGDSGLIAVGDFGSQRISQDYGATWSSMSDYYPGSDELEQRVYGVDFLESAPLTGCMVGQFSRILRTTDGGCNWTDVMVGPTSPGLNAIDLDDSGRGVAVGDKGSIFFSTDFGVTWSPGSFSTGGPSLVPFFVSFQDVALVGAGEAWAVGNNGGKPIVAYSNTQGATWSFVNPPTSNNLRLTGVSLANPSEGLVVGRKNIGGGNTQARSYRLSFVGGVATWTNVSPTSLAATSRLNAVAISGSSLATATAVAVGNDGLILEWNGSAWNMASSSGVNAGTDYLSVDVSPSGNTVLVGGDYDENLSTANDKGLMFRRDSTGWNQIRSICGKDLRGISLTSDTAGFVLGQTGVGSASFNNGNLASSIILRYLADI